MPSPLDRLVARARRDVDSGWLPACQLAVARDGELVAFETFGNATDDHRFAAYSCTKPIVSAAVWQLLGEGAVDLTTPIAEIVPELSSAGPTPITLEHLLLHTAGLPDAPMHPLDGADPTRRRRAFERWRVQWQPGSRFEYHAASAHWVLADVLERIDGADFRDVVHRRVTEPLGLPRVLGVEPDEQHRIAAPVPVGDAVGGPRLHAQDLARPEVIAAGVPGGGGIMTAATLAAFYQALLHNPMGLWRPEVLADATGTIRCSLPEPLFGIPANRSIGLVIAGDDGQHVLRYAGFGASCSPLAFGHAGLHMQVGWADPSTGISFAYLTSGADSDTIREGARGVALSDLAARI